MVFLATSPFLAASLDRTFTNAHLTGIAQHEGGSVW
jgi:hypothetical protein